MAILYKKKNTLYDRGAAESMEMIKRKFKSYNIFKFIFIYIFVIVLILFAMGIYSYRFLIKTVYSDFLSGNEQYLSAIVSRHENDMQIADNIVTQIGLIDGTSRFYLSKNPEKAEELKKSLKGYTTVSQFFDLLFYRYHDDEYFYHYLSSVSEKFLKEHGLTFSEKTTDEFAEMSTAKNLKLRFWKEQEVGGKWFINYRSDESYIIFFRTVQADLKDTLIFMIPGKYYDDLMADVNVDRRIDFLSYDGEIIVTRGSVDVMEEDLLFLMQNEGATAQNWQDEVFHQEITVDKEKYLFIMQQGKSGILYGTLQSMEVYREKIMTEQWTIFILILICMLAGSVIITLASKGFIHKVKQLNGLLNEDSDYDLSKIESGIQTLVTNYKENEKEGLALKKTRFVRNFIRGDFKTKEAAMEEAEKAKLKISKEMYIVVLLKSKEISNENKAYMEMLKVINHQTCLEGYGVHLINNNQNLFVLFSDLRNDIEDFLQGMLEIGKQYSLDYVIACSDYHTDFVEGPKAYLEAVNAFDNYLLLDNSKIIRFSEVAHNEYVSLLPESYLQRLKYAIRTGDKKAAELTVKDICKKLNGEKVSLYSFRIFYNDIIQILLSEWKGERIQFDNFYNVFTLSQCLNLQEFGELLCEICNRIIDGYTGKEVSISSVVEEAITYMQGNFHNPELTMNALAEHLGVSSVSLSVEFKNEMDVKPSDYLANLRIEKAKELLASSDMRIRDISFAVGYEDDRVFMRRFKKYTGMTPGEYRRGH